jgi:hypothetical protein
VTAKLADGFMILCVTDRTSDGLFKYIEQVISKLECDKKLVSQTYNGASVMKGHVTDLQTKVFFLSYPSALFTHCNAHSINLVLQQSLAVIK